MKVLRSIGYFLTTLIIYLVPPLLGWGLRDWRGFLSLAPRAGYAFLVGLLGLGVALQSLGDIRGFRGAEGVQGKQIMRQHIVRFAIIGFMYASLAFLPYSDKHSIGTLDFSLTWRWAGLVLVATGFVFIVWSGISLGKYYSPEVILQKDHQIIKDGLYRFIRHPRYLGALILGTGFCLLFDSLIGLFLILPFAAVLFFRISDEEKFMRREFGEEWDAYCQKTWQLIPLIY